MSNKIISAFVDDRLK